jgi:tetratricopeptide (TPR) repeat protein
LTRAVSALRQAVSLNHAFHEAHYVLGLCLKDREQLTEARAAFEQALTLSPAFIAAREELAELHRLQERVRDEIDQLAALAALDPEKPERLVAIGLAYLRAGNRERAVTTLGQAAERFPKHPGVYAALGQVWLDAAEERGDPSDLRKALEALEPVATQSTASSETLGMYGRALVLAGRHDEAEAVFRQASQRFPTDPDVLPHYASVAQRLGHLDEARQALIKYSVLVDEDRDEAVRAARIADLSMQLNDAAAAVAWYQKSDALRTSDASLLARMADAQSRAGQLEAARATIRQALEKDPNHPLVRAVARRLQAR